MSDFYPLISYGTCAMKLMLLIAVMFGLSIPVFAQEIWVTEEGNVLYERDIDGTDIAVFAFEDSQFYIEGLAGNQTDRGSYQGVWLADNTQDLNPQLACSVSIVRPGTRDEISAFWGTVEITFIDKGVPGIWVGYIGTCFDGPDTQIIARPVIR